MNAINTTAGGGRPEIGRHAAAFGLSVGITSIVNALLVVLKETNEETVLAWMKAATGHHWITHGIVDLVVFVALGFALLRVGEAWRARPNAIIAVALGGIVVGALIIAGFFA